MKRPSLASFGSSFLFVLILAVSFRAWTADLFDCGSRIKLKDHHGITYLSLVESFVKPRLDEIAEQGYRVASASKLIAALDLVDSKVKNKALRAAGGLSTLSALSKAIEGQKVSLYNLPNLIGSFDSHLRKYDLMPFVGLASCGGVAIEYSEANYSYNIHYGTGKHPKDDRTGRSFGSGPAHKALDASDKDYLADLHKVAQTEPSLDLFYRTLLATILASDSSHISKLSPFEQTTLTDFLAVYTAEQDRNLMDGKITPHWDAALLEVTLLSALHAGQSRFALLFKDPHDKKQKFTSVVYHQAPGGEPRKKLRLGSMVDYWQFSSNPAPEFRNRSGINITKNEFRTLGQEITLFERQMNPEIVAKIEAKLGISQADNLFYELSKFIIRQETPKSLGETAKALTEAFAELLAVARKDADLISETLRQKYPSDLILP